MSVSPKGLFQLRAHRLPQLLFHTPLRESLAQEPDRFQFEMKPAKIKPRHFPDDRTQLFLVSEVLHSYYAPRLLQRIRHEGGQCCNDLGDLPAFVRPYLADA